MTRATNSPGMVPGVNGEDSNMAKAEKKRVVRTPAERAQDALDTQKRVLAGVEKRLAAARSEVRALEEQLAAAGRKLQYLAQNPDLPEQDEQVVPDAEGDVEGDGATTES